MSDETKVKEVVIPELVLDPTVVEAPVKVEEEAKYEPMLDMKNLSAQEQQIVKDFSSKIDLNNTNIILQYGAAAQSKIASFSETTLNSVRTKDLGEVGEAITDLVSELKGFDLEEDSKGVFGFFKKQANKLQMLKARYDKAEINVDRICNVLERHQVTLLKDISMLDEMYDLNETYFKELSMYIMAGKLKLETAKNEELPKLLAVAQQSGLPEDAQKANDYSALINRFEKKLHDLELTRMISIQMGPQIRLVQNNDILMSEKIQTSLVNTIPLWKSQMVLALGVAHATEAMEAQRAVTDTTNALLKKNAETLKMSSIETAKESERGIVDIETLKHTNQTLIETLDEVLSIQKEGREKRAQAEQELIKIEGELKQKLLDVRK